MLWVKADEGAREHGELGEDPPPHHRGMPASSIPTLTCCGLWVEVDEGGDGHGEFRRRSASMPSRYVAVVDLNPIVLWVKADEGIGRWAW